MLVFALMFCLVLPAQDRKGKPTRKSRTTTSAAQKQQKPAETVKDLRKKKQQVEQEHQKAVKKQKELSKNVKLGMENLMIIDTEILRQRQLIDTIRHDISRIDNHICLLDSQLTVLEHELEDRRQRYMKSMRYMHRNRSVQSQLAYIFSADNFNQMYRRMRFTKEYASFQRAQGEAVQAKQEQIRQKRLELSDAKQQKDTLLLLGEHEQRTLENKQTEQKAQVEKLKKERKSVTALIERQQKEEAALDARIEKLVADEIAREKARQETEAKKNEETEAEIRHEQALARKRAAAEAARKENDRRIAEAKAKEAEAKKRAEAAKNKSAKERELAEQSVKETHQEVEKAEKKAREDEQQHKEDMSRLVAAKKEIHSARTARNDALSNNFKANKGRLPLPITGNYKLVRGYGDYHPADVVGKDVKIHSNGWLLKGEKGAMARSIFNGTVTGVINEDGRYVVLVRHGRYISAYINLSSSNVKAGQTIKAYDTIGKIGSDGTMSFQLREWNTLLNPAHWIKR